MEGTVFIVCFVLWNTFIDGVFAGEHCYNWYYSETYYCEWGCCGDDEDRGCCSMAGLIVGCCLAGIAIIAFIVAVICCCIKHKGKPGRVIGTSTVTTTTTTTQHYPTMQMQPMGTGTAGQPYMNYSHPYGPPPAYPNQPPPGPAYPNQPPAGPPSSAVYSDPAYPPPSAPPPPYKR